MRSRRELKGGEREMGEESEGEEKKVKWVKESEGELEGEREVGGKKEGKGIQSVPPTRPTLSHTRINPTDSLTHLIIPCLLAHSSCS